MANIPESNFFTAVEHLTEVAELHSNDYEWSEVRVYSDDFMFYWAMDSGCSCNSFGDELGADALKILDSIYSPAFRDAVDNAYDISAQERADFITKVRSAVVPT